MFFPSLLFKGIRIEDGYSVTNVRINVENTLSTEMVEAFMELKHEPIELKL